MAIWGKVPPPKGFLSRPQPPSCNEATQLPEEPDPRYGTPISEDEFPEFLKRGSQYSPKVTPPSQRPLSATTEKQKERIEEYYQETPQATAPAPTRRRINTGALLTAAFASLSLLGIISAVGNFCYQRGSAKVSVSLAFVHAEIALLFIAMIVMYYSLGRK